MIWISFSLSSLPLPRRKNNLLSWSHPFLPNIICHMCRCIVFWNCWFVVNTKITCEDWCPSPAVRDVQSVLSGTGPPACKLKTKYWIWCQCQIINNRWSYFQINYQEWKNKQNYKILLHVFSKYSFKIFLTIHFLLHIQNTLIINYYSVNACELFHIWNKVKDIIIQHERD